MKNKQKQNQKKKPKKPQDLFIVVIHPLPPLQIKSLYLPYFDKAPQISDKSPAINKACRLGTDSEPMLYHHSVQIPYSSEVMIKKI